VRKAGEGIAFAYSSWVQQREKAYETTGFFLLAILISLTGYAQRGDATAIRLGHLEQQGVLLNQGWKFHPGDTLTWAEPDYEDSHWQAINPTEDIYNLPQLWQTNVGWFRLRFSGDSALRQQSLVMMILQTGASEIYLNDKLIKQLGRVSPSSDQTINWQLLWEPSVVRLTYARGFGNQKVKSARRRATGSEEERGRVGN
jgi:hypothetical protein